MNGDAHRSQPGWYEVTVVGPIGPVLRQALKPCRAEPVQAQTIVRARARPEVDLLDVAEQLHARGATVAGIMVIDDLAARRPR